MESNAGDANHLLGRYRVTRTLGTGGYGVVVCAYDTLLKRRVAIKTLTAQTEGDPEYRAILRERFMLEAEAGARMGFHPNLVGVLDLVSGPDGALHLIQEYVAGGSLRERLAGGPLGISDALRLAGFAALGLQRAHDVGLVHRDVKPANLFLTHDGSLKVGDFGIAQVDERSQRTHASRGHSGTALYMSPEQSSTSGYLPPASDQYSLGLTLFEMLFGVAYKRLPPRQPWEMLRGTEPAVANLIWTMLRDDPGERLPAMRDVALRAGEIDRGLAQRPPAFASPDHLREIAPTVPATTPRISLAPVAPPRRSPAHIGRNRLGPLAWGLTLAAIVLALGLAAAAVALSRQSGGSRGAPATATPPGSALAAQPISTPAASATPTLVPTDVPTPAAATPTFAPSATSNATAVAATGTNTILATLSAVATEGARPTLPPPVPPTAVPAPPATATNIPPPTSAPATPTTIPAATPRPTAPPVPAASNASLGQTWTDPNGRFKVQYPNGWTATKLANSQSNVVELDGPDGVSFYVDIYKQNGTPADELTATNDARAKSTQFTFTNGPVTDAKVGGESGKVVSYTAKRKDQTTGTGTDGVLWIVNHNGSEYDFEALAIGRHRPEVDAILASITFLGSVG